MNHECGLQVKAVSGAKKIEENRNKYASIFRSEIHTRYRFYSFYHQLFSFLIRFRFFFSSQSLSFSLTKFNHFRFRYRWRKLHWSTEFNAASPTSSTTPLATCRVSTSEFDSLAAIAHEALSINSPQYLASLFDYHQPVRRLSSFLWPALPTPSTGSRSFRCSDPLLPFIIQYLSKIG